MHQIIAYILFLLRSKNKHAIHSPFVFELYTKALSKASANKEEWRLYKQIKKAFRNSNKSISIKDLGAGSRRTKAKKRAIREIAKNAGITDKRAKILYQLVRHLKPKKILELGTSLGLSSAIMALASRNTEIITIEGCPQTHKIAKEMLKKHKLSHVNSLLGPFEDHLSSVLKENDFDLIFIDGNHTKEATINYFNIMLDYIHNDTCIIFDDIHWSKGMSDAWKTIYESPKVKVSIDTFLWGVVFFRKEQEKEHFVLRV